MEGEGSWFMCLCSPPHMGTGSTFVRGGVGKISGYMGRLGNLKDKKLQGFCCLFNKSDTFLWREGVTQLRDLEGGKKLDLLAHVCFSSLTIHPPQHQSRRERKGEGLSGEN